VNGFTEIFREGEIKPIGEFIHKDVIADQDRRDHRSGRDLIGFVETRANEENQNQCGDDRNQVIEYASDVQFLPQNRTDSIRFKGILVGILHVEPHRKPNDFGAARDVLVGNKTPEPGIVREVAVVAHDE
jgi:hypothetical protein